MKLKKLPFVVSMAVSSMFAATANAATQIPQEFESIHRAVSVPSDSSASYFVRVELDPVVVWVKKQEAAGVEITPEAKQAYISTVKTALDKVVQEAESAGFVVVNPVVVTDVGFSVSTTKDQVSGLSQLSQVGAVVPKPLQVQQRTYSTSWIGGTRAHEEYDIKGSGQTIAVIDTGIDYFHSDLGGSGDVLDFLLNDPAVVEPDSFPTATVIGGYDFAGFDYDARFAATSIPAPDLDPADDGSHGSHVSGIAAGRGIGEDGATGIAPEASLLALKVFGAVGSTALTSQAIEMAVDPNGDGDPSDAVDVINMSLGSIFGSPENSASISAQNAYEAGTVVVASAGNSGNDIPYISGSPGAAEGVIAVASSISGGVESFFVSFATSEGETYEFIAPYAAISPELTGVLDGALTIAEPYDACTPLSNSFDGGIALITRGNCAFTTKLSLAAEAGASAAVVVNNVAGPAIVMGGTDVTIPGAMITLTEGNILLSLLEGVSIAAEFSDDNLVADESDDDVISTFSSRGPGPTGLFKPDVTAPGDQIESAFAGTGTASLTISGTSMAAPQVAGMAALILERFPDLEPPAVKAIIQNTAKPASLFGVEGSPPLSLQGTGVVDIEKALNATAYASPGGIGFGVFKPEYNADATRWVEVTNMLDEDQRFSIEIEGNMGADSAGVIIDTPSEVFVPAGQTSKFPVTIRIQSSEVERTTAFQEFDGWVVLTSDSSEMRVGYTSVVEPSSIVNVHSQGDSYSLHNIAFGDAEVYGYTAATSPDLNLGFRSVSADSMLFAFNADTDWDQFSKYALTMNIDADEDGQDDYQVLVGDLNTLDPVGFLSVDGRIASSITDLNTGATTLLYLAGAGYNSSVVEFQIDVYGFFGFLSDEDRSFDYTLTLQNLYSAASTPEVSSGTVVVSEQAVFDFPAIGLPKQETFTIEVDDSSGAQPIFIIPTESSPAKRLIAL